jgi:hypothetical protein
MFRGLFIGTRRGLEGLGTLGKSELVQVGEGQLLPFQNSQSKVKKDCCRICQPACAQVYVRLSLAGGAFERRCARAHLLCARSQGLQHASKVFF